MRAFCNACVDNLEAAVLRSAPLLVWLAPGGLGRARPDPGRARRARAERVCGACVARVWRVCGAGERDFRLTRRSRSARESLPGASVKLQEGGVTWRSLCIPRRRVTLQVHCV